MSADETRSILVVDDDEVFRNRLVRALSERGFDARGADGATAAKASAATDSPELAVVDLRMPDGSGLDVVRALKEMDAATKIGRFNSRQMAADLCGLFPTPDPAAVTDPASAPPPRR